MWYPEQQPPRLRPIPANITIRTFEPGDGPAMLLLLQRNNQLGEWDESRLLRENATLVPGATVLAFDGARMVAMCGVHDRSWRGEPAWELGYVAADPEYMGMGLGRYCTGAAIRGALDLPNREIFLLTDDHRLPAISVYLDLGLLRDASTRGFRKRWRAIGRELRAYRASRERDASNEG